MAYVCARVQDVAACQQLAGCSSVLGCCPCLLSGLETTVRVRGRVELQHLLQTGVSTRWCLLGQDVMLLCEVLVAVRIVQWTAH